MAPESFKGQYGHKCDLWACGIIMFLLISGEAPFDLPSNDKKLQNVIKTFDFRETIEGIKSITEEGRDLLIQMLEKDPKKRISARDALSHPWFKKDELTLSHIALDRQVLENVKGFKVTNINIVTTPRSTMTSRGQSTTSLPQT